MQASLACAPEQPRRRAPVGCRSRPRRARAQVRPAAGAAPARASARRRRTCAPTPTSATLARWRRCSACAPHPARRARPAAARGAWPPWSCTSARASRPRARAAASSRAAPGTASARSGTAWGGCWRPAPPACCPCAAWQGPDSRTHARCRRRRRPAAAMPPRSWCMTSSGRRPPSRGLARASSARQVAACAPWSMLAENSRFLAGQVPSRHTDDARADLTFTHIMRCLHACRT